MFLFHDLEYKKCSVMKSSKLADSQVRANNLEPRQEQSDHVCSSSCIFWTHYCLVKPHCSHFRIITAVFPGIQKVLWYTPWLCKFTRFFYIFSDLFPPGCVSPMLTAAKKCFHIAAYGAWDNCEYDALLSYKCTVQSGNIAHIRFLMVDW